MLLLEFWFFLVLAALLFGCLLFAKRATINSRISVRFTFEFLIFLNSVDAPAVPAVVERPSKPGEIVTELVGAQPNQYQKCELFITC